MTNILMSNSLCYILYREAVKPLETSLPVASLSDGSELLGKASHSMLSQGDSVKLKGSPLLSTEEGENWVCIGDRGPGRISCALKRSSAAFPENPSIIPSKGGSSLPIFRRVVSFTFPKGL